MHREYCNPFLTLVFGPLAAVRATRVGARFRMRACVVGRGFSPPRLSRFSSSLFFFFFLLFCLLLRGRRWSRDALPRSLSGVIGNSRHFEV